MTFFSAWKEIALQNSLIFDIASAQKSQFLKQSKNVFSTNLFWFLLLNICGHISGAGCQVQACGEQGNALVGDRGVGEGRGAGGSNFEKIYEVYLQGDTIFKREISYLCSW